MSIALIAAVQTHDKGIGFQGKLPWRITADLRHFQEKTTNKIVVMGKRTFQEDFECKPLPNRMNVVITHRALPYRDQPPNVVMSDSTDIKKYQLYTRILTGGKVLDMPDLDIENIMVIGGQEIYNLFLPQADRLYITEVRDLTGAKFECDRFFPDYSDWILDKSSQEFVQGNIGFSFKEFVR